MTDVIRLPETDAPARRAASGRALLQAIVLVQAIVLAGLVACALLLALGLPPASGRPASAGREGAAVTRAQVVGEKVAPSGRHASAWTMAEIDDVPGDPRVAAPAPGALPRPSAVGFHRHRDVPVPARDSPPPDRPPRHA